MRRCDVHARRIWERLCSAFSVMRIEFRKSHGGVEFEIDEEHGNYGQSLADEVLQPHANKPIGQGRIRGDAPIALLPVSGPTCWASSSVSTSGRAICRAPSPISRRSHRTLAIAQQPASNSGFRALSAGFAIIMASRAKGRACFGRKCILPGGGEASEGGVGILTRSGTAIVPRPPKFRLIRLAFAR